MFELVFDYTDVGNFTFGKELVDIAVSSIERKIAEMRSVWWLGGKGKRLAGESTVGKAIYTLSASLIIWSDSGAIPARSPPNPAAELKARRSPPPKPRESVLLISA